MTPSPPPAHHDIAPAGPPTLAELAAKARHLRQPKTAQLEAHREELLRLRRDGDSVEVLATALRGLGVEISAEALRLWLNRQLPRKRMKRDKTPHATAPQEPMPATPQPEPEAAVLSGAAATGDAAAAVVTPTAVPIEAAPASPAPVAGVSEAPTSSPQSVAGSVSAEPAKPYTPWRSNFTPLIIGSRPREPKTAPGNS